jgi:hypothetical protein
MAVNIRHAGATICCGVELKRQNVGIHDPIDTS